jgi:uncharacterized protein (DUF433 family)
LFEAVENHRPGANIEFPIYAEHQIRHAILESLRDPDRWSRSFGLATAQAEMANGEEPSAAQERAPFGRTARMPRLDRITRNPGIMGGKPCLRGMRVTVGTLVGLCAAGHSFPEILEAYPYIQEEDIRQALAYAAWRVQELELPLPAA